MAVTLSRQPIISRDALQEIGDTRLSEAEALFQASHYAGTVYLGGYAVECYLKLAVCVTLGWPDLLGTFKVHDLEGLLLYSGFDKDLRADSGVYDSFAKIATIWKVEGSDSVRYRRAVEFDEPTAKRFLQYVSDPTAGVLPWFRRVIS